MESGLDLIHHAEGNPEIRWIVQGISLEGFRDNADHGIEMTVQFDCPTHRVGRRIELASPEFVSEYCYRMRVALLTLPRKECPTQNRMNAQDIEIIACNKINLDWLRMVSNVCKHGFGCSSSRCHVYKHIGQRAEIKKVRVRDIECADSPFPCAVEANQLIQILHARQSSEEKRVR